MSRIQGTKSDALSLALVGGTFAVTAAIYEKLPVRFPIHFDIHGQPDGWSSRAFGAFLLPAMALVVWALVRFGGRIAGRTFRERLEASPVQLVAFLTVAFMSAMHFVILWSALHHGHDIGRSLGVVFGLFWIVLAQVMPRVRRNPFIGVRTAWTLSSDENWARTHRVAGWTFTVGGLIAVLAALVGLPAIAIMAIVVSGLAPALYSWVLARRVT